MRDEATDPVAGPEVEAQFLDASELRSVAEGVRERQDAQMRMHAVVWMDRLCEDRFLAAAQEGLHQVKVPTDWVLGRWPMEEAGSLGNGAMRARALNILCERIYHDRRIKAAFLGSNPNEPPGAMLFSWAAGEVGGGGD